MKPSRRPARPTASDPGSAPCAEAEPLHERLRAQLAGTALPPSAPAIEALLAKVSATYREHEQIAARLTRERDEMEELLSTHQQRSRALAENALDITAVVSSAGRIEYASPSVERVMGYAPAELVGRDVLQLVHAEDAAEMQQELQRAARMVLSEKTILARFRHRNGSWRVLEIVCNNCLEHPTVAGIVINCRDITERTLAQERIRHLAHHDELTGLPNRNLFRDRAQQAMAQAERSQRRLALMFLDLDRFKHINDSLGHHVGDRLLRQMAERLAGSVRQMDTVARLGGDEFVIVLADLQDVRDLAPLAGKLLEIIAAPVHLEGNELHVSGSIGISVFPDDGGDLDTLMRNADTAMYHAKESGRNNFQYFTARMNAVAQERLVLETRLRRAIRQQEFVLHYQPVVSAMTGVIVGMEALVRWQDPERGLVPPAQFIPGAEDAGLINALGAWVLQEACRQNREWQDAGRFHLPVAVNLSAEQFRSRALLDTVSQALAHSGLEPRYLELEITETLLMEQSEQTVSLLARLNALGLQLSIDDFGTGYSSLSYLTRFPIHKLKIDKSFVRNIGSDASDAAITSAVIALAHSLKLKVLAEGVETRAQLDFLRLRGCHELQGFLFSKPLPARELAQLVARWDAGTYATPIPADALHPFIAV